MSKSGKKLFGGSRFLFWSLAPILAIFAVVFPFMITEWTARSYFLVAIIEPMLVAFILGLLNPQRFRWATRCGTGLVFCLYLVFAINQVFLSGKSLGAGSGKGKPGELSPLRAIMGLIVIGLPCLWYTVRGRWSLKGGDEPDGGGPSALDKIDP
jgi:hypothetical protein